MKSILIFTILCLPLYLSAQDNNQISTMRIGPYRLQMKGKETEKLARKKMIEYTDYKKYNAVMHNGNEIRINVSDDGEGDTYVIQLATVSPAFKTFSGIGVGNTRKELFDTYIHYPNFFVYESYDENGNIVLGESYFNLEDRETATILSFRLKDNVIVEVLISYNLGC